MFSASENFFPGRKLFSQIFLCHIIIGILTFQRIQQIRCDCQIKNPFVAGDIHFLSQALDIRCSHQKLFLEEIFHLIQKIFLCNKTRHWNIPGFLLLKSQTDTQNFLLSFYQRYARPLTSSCFLPKILHFSQLLQNLHLRRCARLHFFKSCQQILKVQPFKHLISFRCI